MLKKLERIKKCPRVWLGVRKLLTLVVLSPDGEQISTPYFLNTGSFEGKLARLRKSIELLKSKRDVIAGENLTTLMNTGRGSATKSRWQKWRNYSTVHSQIAEKLRYKAKLNGVKLRFENPRHTSHTCPRCGEESQTFSSPEYQPVNGWAVWMKYPHCGWNGSHGNAAAINIARLAALTLRSVK